MARKREVLPPWRLPDEVHGRGVSGLLINSIPHFDHEDFSDFQRQLNNLALALPTDATARRYGEVASIYDHLKQLQLEDWTRLSNTRPKLPQSETTEEGTNIDNRTNFAHSVFESLSRLVLAVQRHNDLEMVSTSSTFNFPKAS
jgi:hypothetical protein